ncbi:MAG: hydrogenase maturation protease [bacterium]
MDHAQSRRPLAEGVKPAPRVLIAGVGNVLHRDDGFGVEVIRRLQEKNGLPHTVKVVETGIGGISLVQELYAGYDALLLVDAVSRDGKPGQIYVLEAEVGDISDLPLDQKRDFLADMHYTNPNRALMLARALNVLPGRVAIVGCEPCAVDGLGMELSAEIQRAIPKAVEQIETWIHDFYRNREGSKF